MHVSGRPRRRVQVSAYRRLLQVHVFPSKPLARARAIRTLETSTNMVLLRARGSALLSAACVCCVFALARGDGTSAASRPASRPPLLSPESGGAPGWLARFFRPARARAPADPTAPRAADAERVDFHAAAAELGITPAEFAARGLEPELVPHNLTFERRDRRRLNELDGWMDARATWYGGPSGPGPDGMSIYTGSCGYGQALGNHFISAWYDDHFPPRAAPRERPPRRTAVRRNDEKPTTRTDADAPSPLITHLALSRPRRASVAHRRHTNGGYDWGLTDKCGQCFEVVCVDGATRGKEWSDLGPWGGCTDAGKKSVTVKISDSCPCQHPNPSNKRWCCGDVTHLDLSYAAFDQIAERHRGVVDLKVRPASCSKQGVVAFYE